MKLLEKSKSEMAEDEYMKLGKLPLMKDLSAGLVFLAKLPAFLRKPLSFRQAERILNNRFEKRTASFLEMLKRDVFGNRESFYGKLLQWIHCEPGDIRKLVRKEGVEGTLKELYQQGVYLTLDEFKGRKPVVRGSCRFSVEPDLLRGNPASSSLEIQTSGSSGQCLYVPVNFQYIKDRSVNVALDVAARKGLDWKHAVWGIPSGSSLVHILELCGAGIRPTGWFSHLNPSDSRLHPRYQWGIYALRLGSLFSLAPLPRLRRASVEDPSPALRWIVEKLRSGATPHLFGYLSSIIRLCQAASEAGIQLQGAQFTVTGEPVTSSRLAYIRKTGAKALPRYGAAETGTIGYGCLKPEDADEVHLLHDRVAVIQENRTGHKIPHGSLFVTSLLPSTPFVLLNVSLGDRGIMTRRRCNCPLGRYGWNTHLHSIYSDEKCTCEGMSFPNADLIRFIEEVLPKRFGGNPTHYQFVEAHGDNGLSVLKLLAHPSVGPVDIEAVNTIFYEAPDSKSGVETIMKSLWREARVLKVERRPPIATLSGKIRPVYSER